MIWHVATATPPDWMKRKDSWMLKVTLWTALSILAAVLACTESTPVSNPTDTPNPRSYCSELSELVGSRRS